MGVERRRPRRRGTGLRVRVAAIGLVLASAAVAFGSTSNPFAFFAPSVPLNDGDRDLLVSGGTIARSVPGSKQVIAVFSATAIAVDADRLIAWTRDIADLKQSKYVAAIGRFSNPPQIGDLAGLTLDDGDIADLGRCRPGRCGIKLGEGEVNELQRVARERGTGAPLQEAFRQLVLRRVVAYLASGQAGLPTYDERGGSLQEHFAAILQQSPFLPARLPAVSAALERWPHAPAPEAESFLYWSKEQYGAKPVTSVTHVMIVRGDGAALPDVVVLGKQVFATHYTDGSLSVTAIVRDGPQRFLLYLNRSDIDVLRGFWGGLIRRILERRLRSEAPAMLLTLRQRLEGGNPPRAPNALP